MGINEYTCPGDYHKFAVEKDARGRIKRVLWDDNADDPNNPNALYLCPFCHNELVPQTIKSAKQALDNSPRSALGAIAMMTANVNKEPENVEMLTTLGLFQVMNGGYADGLTLLEKSKGLDPMNSAAYFYYAIGLLKGRSSRLAQKPDVLKAIENLNSAIAFEIEPSKQGLYKVLYAYIQYDYFETRCMLAKPSSTSLLSEAIELGVDDDEVDDLFGLLKVSKPATFR